MDKKIYDGIRNIQDKIFEENIANKERFFKNLCIEDLFIEYMNQGLAYDGKGNFDEAIKCYEKAIEIKKNNHKAFNNMGLSYFKKGNHDKAIECYEKALKIKEDSIETFNNMGIAYNGKGNYDKAMECYEKAVEIKNDFPDAFYNMGITYSRKGNYDKAIECFEKAVEIRKDFHQASGNSGFLYFKMGNLEKAKHFCLRSIESGNKNTAYMNMGHIYFVEGKIDDAYRSYKTSILNFADKRYFFVGYDDDFQYLKQYGISYNDYMKMKNRLLKIK
jgi:superkiller protein 3